MRLVVRPLLSFIVLAALVFALLQGVGRLAFGLLAHLEVAANQILVDRHIRVSGLQGGWRGFDPVIRIAHLELPAGHLEDVYVELDLLETLLHSRAVLYRARVADGSLLLEKVEGAGWRLAGMPSGGKFDPVPLLTESDQLQYRGAIGFRRDDQTASMLDVDYVGTNRDGIGRHRLVLRNAAEDCASPCELRLEAELQQGAWVVRDARTALTVSATNFVVPEPLLGFATLQLDAVELDWQGNAEASSGRALLLASGALRSDGRPFAARLGAVGRGRDGRHWGRVTRFEVTAGGERLDLPGLAIDVEDGLLHAALSAVPVAGITRLARSILAGHEVASRWLDALALEATVGDLHAIYRFATGEVGYAFDVTDFAMNGYRGVPAIRHGAGRVLGYTRLRTGRPQFEVGHVVQIDIDGTDMGIAFPEHLHGDWRLPYARGRLQAWFRRDEFRMRGLDLAARTGDSELRGSLGIARLGKDGGDERDKRVAALARIDRITVAEARRFVPIVLQPRLYEWLTETPMDGVMADARIAYQGQFRVPPGTPGRRLEIAGQVDQGRIRFLPDWPEVQGFTGSLEVAGRDVRAVARTAESLGADLSGSRFWLRDGGAVADVALTARLDASQALALVRQSPLGKAMAFVTPDWSGRGPLRVSGAASIPVREFAQQKVASAGTGGTAAETAVPEGLAVDLAIDLDGIDLDLPGYRLAFDALRGPLGYVFPATLTSDGITGTLFDAPVRITAASADHRFRLGVRGTARQGDLWRVIDVRDLGLTEGRTAFDALLDVEAPAGAGARRDGAPPPKLTVRSDLTGLAVRLPGRYAKPVDEAVPLAVDLVMPGEERRLTFSYRDATGWLRFTGRLEQGSIGLGVDPPTLSRHDREVRFAGRIDRLGLDDLGAGGGSTAGLPLPVRLREFAVDRLVIGSLAIENAHLEADLGADGFDVRVDSDDLVGRASRHVDPARAADAGPMPIDLAVARLHLPAAKGDGDPLAPDIIGRIPPMNVTIDELTAGDADYGRWRFELRPEGDDLWFRKLEARLRKVDIEAEEGVVWRGVANETTFRGQLSMANLAEVLPLWGYAPSVESEMATVKGTMTWPGSPVSFGLLRLRGEADARAKTGRFLDVQAGGGTQRILSLLNFTTIAKRISLDFSDVFGKGLSFDKLKASFRLNDGLLELVKPLDVEGTGLKFKLYGTVNLPDRVLNHDMIVTLPVSRGLPWYAAYVALANPLAGLGVLVGERVLRKPLEQFSSARYKISGTVENPEVKLVSVFAASGSEADRPVEVPVQSGSPAAVVDPGAAGAGAPLPDAVPDAAITPPPQPTTDRKTNEAAGKR